MADSLKALAERLYPASLDWQHLLTAVDRAMSYLIALLIGLFVGALYALLGVRSPAPPTVALVGLLGMLIGENLLPWGRTALTQWFQ